MAAGGYAITDQHWPGPATSVRITRTVVTPVRRSALLSLAAGQPLPNIIESAIHVAIVADHESFVTNGNGQPVDPAHELLKLSAVDRQRLLPAVDHNELRPVLTRDATAQETPVVRFVVNDML